MADGVNEVGLRGTGVGGGGGGGDRGMGGQGTGKGAYSQIQWCSLRRQAKGGQGRAPDAYVDMRKCSHALRSCPSALLPLLLSPPARAASWPPSLQPCAVQPCSPGIRATCSCAAAGPACKPAGAPSCEDEAWFVPTPRDAAQATPVAPPWGCRACVAVSSPAAAGSSSPCSAAWSRRCSANSCEAGTKVEHAACASCACRRPA